MKFWTLIDLINNFVEAEAATGGVLLLFVFGRNVTSEEDITSAQQLLLCLPLFFVFSSEVNKNVLKALLTDYAF